MIDSKLKEFQRAENKVELPSVSIMNNLKAMRKQRCGMITQKIQYLFCYEALLAEAVSVCGFLPAMLLDESDGYDSYDTDE